MNTTIFTLFPAGLLYMLLAIAVASDLHNRRIPNILVFPGILAGLALHTAIPSGAGFFNTVFGGLGFLEAVSGAALGLAFFLPMYALRAMGAGDVKLMAMIGAFFGSYAILRIALLTMIAGGLLAIFAALRKGTLLQVLTNIRYMVTHSLIRIFLGGNISIDKPISTTGRFPYAGAIASGTIIYVVMLRFDQWNFLQ